MQEVSALPFEILDNLFPFSKKSRIKMGMDRDTQSQRRHGGVDSSNIGTQNYQEIRHQCLSRGALFEDPNFPASDVSLFRGGGSSNRRIQWKRPYEISNAPKFIVEGASRFDIKQGEIGDCWLLAAIANLTLDPKLLEKVVPSHQTFHHEYIGAFYFRFWQFGEWVEVVIDDRLPTVDGKLKYLRSSAQDEFWSPLLEKAYAKMYGSYDALNGGITTNAMIDFTGGVSEIFELKKPPRNLLSIMLKAVERGSLLACSIQANPLKFEDRCSNGLVRGHAYSITKLVYCDVSSYSGPAKIPLIRIRNPWGNETEWNGPWSDKSREWNMVSQSERYNLGLTFEKDGEFWMSHEDFLKNFSFLEMMNINLQFLKERDLGSSIVKHSWEVQKFTGSWISGVSAGGCTNYHKSFYRNPKFILTLREEDDGDNDRKCTTIVALLQRSKRSRSHLVPIGFSVFPVPPNVDPQTLDARYFRKTSEISGLETYTNRRQVSHRFELPAGVYCVIPSTMKPNEEAEFLLRIFSEKPNPMTESNEILGFGQIQEQVLNNQVISDMPNSAATKTPQQMMEAQPPVDLKDLFSKVAGWDMEVDWKELQTVLNNKFKTEFTFEGFSKSACRSMVAIMDGDQSGKLGYDEFVHLWNVITMWKNAFLFHDKDRSGYLDGFEFRDALSASGYNLNSSIMFSLLTIYGSETREISFDDFTLCLIRMSRALQFFAEKDFMRNNQSCFNFEEFITAALCM